MIKTTHTQQGFAHAFLIIGLVVALIGALGFVFWQNFIHKEAVVANDNTIVATKKNDANDNTVSEGEAKTATTVDDNKGYVVLKDWGLRFKMPAGLSRVDYLMNGDRVSFYAKPTGYDVEYRSNYNEKGEYSEVYALGTLIRSDSPTKQLMDWTVKGKKVGGYYYYTLHSFSSLSTGAGNNGLYFDKSCDAKPEAARCEQLVKAETKAFTEINDPQGQKGGMLRSIEVLK